MAEKSDQWRVLSVEFSMENKDNHPNANGGSECFTQHSSLST